MISPGVAVGDRVNILGPYSGDSILVEMQHSSATVASGDYRGFMVTLDGTWPADLQFGPFPESRLRKPRRQPS